ncbi:bll1836 [Bradyrhizobium diazoefficiens USDA 110]|uniref:Bll1836 protein n=1 Tax=Bradyrhizobium diazoefficiens (strain JCM 10833 / BCRC 13528 / IAM 13628 / NBRC 14792 / USDA 110) TaxID=224911 RepID=Q89TP4_BRADU|nr:hypothetical protein CO678_43425 [Bradyrhizobium diazoefficiens]QBP20709.1 hypothetical protein Bdiaspc4_09305 [Bradyrhizobium diazoefficiens]BAC47101.1 bll1836 [Bradyrhizobium diazoefficiens USDA 110]
MFLNLATLESEMPSVASSLRAMKIHIEARSTSKYAATGGAPAALRKYECASRLRPLDPRVEKQRQLCRRQSYGLRNKTEVLRLLDALRERIAEFGLSLNEEKTRILNLDGTRPSASRAGATPPEDVRLPRVHAHLRGAPNEIRTSQCGFHGS